MKKVRINLRRGQKSWDFMLYDSPESAYYLSHEGMEVAFADEYSKTVTLCPNELLEVEWLGSEYVYVGGLSAGGLKHVKYDEVRLGKMSKVGVGLVELHAGWVASGSVPWTDDDTRHDVRITRIKGRMVAKMDFSELFSAAPDESTESRQEVFS